MSITAPCIIDEVVFCKFKPFLRGIISWKKIIGLVEQKHLITFPKTFVINVRLLLYPDKSSHFPKSNNNNNNQVIVAFKTNCFYSSPIPFVDSIDKNIPTSEKSMSRAFTEIGYACLWKIN